MINAHPASMPPIESIYERRYTVEEYFALEEQSDIRHEYYHGEIFPMDGLGPTAMAGATFAHNTLKQNCVMALRCGKACAAVATGYSMKTCGLISWTTSTSPTPMCW